MGKDKKKKKKAKKEEAIMTPQEAILAYKINIVEKKLEDERYEIRGWEEKNRRHQERNEKLKEDQEMLLRHLLRTFKDFDKMTFDVDVKTREDVVAEMKSMWARRTEREAEIAELQAQLEERMAEVEQVEEEIASWEHFNTDGSRLNQTQIRILEQDLQDMHVSFKEMSTHMQDNLMKTKEEIEKYTDTTLSQQKDKASDKAMSQLDKVDRQEVLDHHWLKREVEIHSKETAKVRERVEDLERTNLEMMSRLFDCKVEDLKVSRNFYLTQMEDVEDLERAGILEMDLADLGTLDPDYRQSPQAPEESLAKKKRPKSAVQKAIEDKVKSVPTSSEGSETAEGEEREETEELVEEEVEEEEVEEEESEEGSEEDDMQDSDFMKRDVTIRSNESVDEKFLEEEDFDDYLRLGPVELKLLSLAGRSVPIHVAERPSLSEITTKTRDPDSWPVTQPMLMRVITPRPY